MKERTAESVGVIFVVSVCLVLGTIFGYELGYYAGLGQCNNFATDKINIDMSVP